MADQELPNFLASILYLRNENIAKYKQIERLLKIYTESSKLDLEKKKIVSLTHEKETQELIDHMQIEFHVNKVQILKGLTFVKKFSEAVEWTIQCLDYYSLDGLDNFFNTFLFLDKKIDECLEKLQECKFYFWDKKMNRLEKIQGQTEDQELLKVKKEENESILSGIRENIDKNSTELTIEMVSLEKFNKLNQEIETVRVTVEKLIPNVDEENEKLTHIHSSTDIAANFIINVENEVKAIMLRIETLSLNKEFLKNSLTDFCHIAETKGATSSIEDMESDFLDRHQVNEFEFLAEKEIVSREYSVNKELNDCLDLIITDDDNLLDQTEAQRSELEGILERIKCLKNDNGDGESDFRFENSEPARVSKLATSNEFKDKILKLSTDISAMEDENEKMRNEASSLTAEAIMKIKAEKRKTRKIQNVGQTEVFKQKPPAFNDSVENEETMIPSISPIPSTSSSDSKQPLTEKLSPLKKLINIAQDQKNAEESDGNSMDIVFNSSIDDL